MIRRTLAPVLLLLVLGGCILVEDFSPMWDKAKPDACISKITEALYYSEFRRDPNGKDMNEHAHVFPVGKYYFLMLKKNPSDTGGRMYRFGVINGIFQRYRLDPVMRDAFMIEFPDAPVSFRHDTVTLANLGESQMKLLTEISSRPEYWEIEDQALYNTMLNPLCQFDDRDVKKLKAEDESEAKAEREQKRKAAAKKPKHDESKKEPHDKNK